MVLQAQSKPKNTEVLEGFPRGVGTQPGRVANARFASSTAVLNQETLRFESKKNQQGKLFLGVVNGTVKSGQTLADGRPSRWIEGGQPIGLPDDRHACTIAGSRAGKGRSAIIPNLLTYPGSTVVIDPKGDLARLTAKYRAKTFGQSLILDPFGVAGESVQQLAMSFNPLQLLTNCPKIDQASNATLIADALVVSQNAKDPHWDDCAREMIAGLCLHVATHPNYEKRRDLVTVWQLGSKLLTIDPDDETKCLLETEMTQNGAGGGKVQAAARSFYDRTGGELSSVVSTLRKHLEWISFQQIKKSLRGVSLDLRDLKTMPTTIYATLPAIQMSALSGWLRLVIQLSLAACESTPQQTQYPVLFVLDEFPVLGQMKSIKTAIAQIAGFGVKLWIILQDLGQLKIYENWETFLGNTGVLQAFGNSDFLTLDYLSKQLGTTQVINESMSSTTYAQASHSGAKGDSYSTATHPLLTPEEIARLFGRDDRYLRQLILRPGYSPIVLQRAFYDKHSLFSSRI